MSGDDAAGDKSEPRALSREDMHERLDALIDQLRVASDEDIASDDWDWPLAFWQFANDLSRGAVAKNLVARAVRQGEDDSAPLAKAPGDNDDPDKRHRAHVTRAALALLLLDIRGVRHGGERDTLRDELMPWAMAGPIVSDLFGMNGSIDLPGRDKVKSTAPQVLIPRSTRSVIPPQAKRMFVLGVHYLAGKEDKTLTNVWTEASEGDLSKDEWGRWNGVNHKADRDRAKADGKSGGPSPRGETPIDMNELQRLYRAATRQD